MGSSIAGPQGSKGAGVRNRGFTLSWEGPGMKELSSLMTPPRMPPCSGQNELTGKAPLFPWRQAESSRKLQAQPSMGTASTTPHLLGEPRNRAGKGKVGGARPPVLGSFHLNSASCVYILSSPHKAWFWWRGLQHIKGSEVVRISDYLTQNPHSVNRETETQGYTWRPCFRI